MNALCLSLLLIQDDGILTRLLDGKDVPAKELSSLAPSPAGRATAVVAWNLRQRAWSVEKEDAEIVRRYLKEKNFTLLVSDILRVKKDGLQLRIARTMALAHLEGIKSRGEAVPDLDLRAKALAVVNDKNDGWVAAEGQIIARVRSEERKPADIEKLIPPGADLAYFQAIEILLSAVRSQDAELADGLVRSAKAFRPVIGPHKRNADTLRGILEGFKFCKNCNGTSSRPCDYGPCENGKVIKCCAVCNGSGKNPQSYHAPNFQTPCPNPGNNGKHKWVEDCVRCHGAGTMPCKNCKAPWKSPAAAELFDRTPCSFCRETGWALELVRLPCPDCAGVGSVVRPPKPPVSNTKED